MNGSQAIQIAGRVGRFCARHLLALLVTVAVPCVLWTLAYFALLIWATSTNGGMGSPATYPFGLFIILVFGTAAAITLFLPATALAEWFARRRGLPILAQIPIAVVILAALCLAIVGVTAAVGAQPSFRGVSDSFVLLFLSHLLPLGLYWWAAQSGPILLSLFQRLRAIRRS